MYGAHPKNPSVEKKGDKIALEEILNPLDSVFFLYVDI